MNNRIIMTAPNGARRTRADHPRLPLTITQTAADARECAAAGADAIHAHLRDAKGKHLLDAGAYRELIAAIADAAPAMRAQITTESVGQYTPTQQRQLLYDLRPAWASLSLSEHFADGDTRAAARLYYWAAEAGVRLQHILYTTDEVRRFRRAIDEQIIPPDDLDILFVLGRYAPATDGAPAMLDDFLVAKKDLPPHRFMVCAFGRQELACLVAAAQHGGSCRIGFENNTQRPDGEPADSNAAQVAALRAALAANRRSE